MRVITPNWPAPSHIKAFTSTRCLSDGQASHPYQGLNLALHVGDSAEQVQANRQALIQAYDIPPSILWLQQTHSTRLLSLQTSPQVQAACRHPVDADASFTALPQVVCAVMTADCLPILLCDQQGQQVAAVHAGWRGLADGIIEQSVAQFSSSPIMAWIGPAIGPDAFEVGEDVYHAMLQMDPDAGKAFQPQPNSGKFLADLPLLAQHRLQQAGVELVYFSNHCTYRNPELFYSYRRAGVTGRQVSLIWKDA